MQIVSDLQIHSRYSRAVSQEMILPKIWEWAKMKGIGLMATGDWTHPLWMREIKANLVEDGSGLLKLKVNPDSISDRQNLEFKTDNGPLFLLATEVSSIYSQGGKLRRIHTLIWAPTIATADKINKELAARGANLVSDGRPIIGLSSIQVAELVFSIEPTCLVIPAHAWTPWFSLYGSESGFDSIEECFGNFSKYIYAIETGLSSDPAMNWRIKELDNRSIISCSDAHSGPKLGREATVYDLSELSYKAIREAIMRPSTTNFSDSTVVGDTGSLGHSIKGDSQVPGSVVSKIVDTRPPSKIAYTIEFYPEEGKYHYTGHRNCNIKQTPEETKKNGVICPVCGRKLTIGVMHRVEQLAGRTEEELGIRRQELKGTKMNGIFSEKFPERAPYVMMVPLQEILSETIGGMPTSQHVQNEYRKMVENLGGEFNVLLNTATDDIEKVSGPKIAEAIDKVRKGEMTVDPGYDGVFGIVKIWDEAAKAEEKNQKEQLSFF